MACRDFAGHHAFYWHCYHAGQWTVRSFDMLLADNAVCYTVQNALKDETQAFARYVRQPTSETEQAYTAACTASEQSLAALPFDYARIGEERYARTWNLLQGYAGYRQERDAFLQLSPSADTYIEQMYHVMALQDYLAEYALRLTQATLEQETPFTAARRLTSGICRGCTWGCS